jgi:hypothetical protein
LGQAIIKTPPGFKSFCNKASVLLYEFTCSKECHMVITEKKFSPTPFKDSMLLKTFLAGV